MLRKVEKLSLRNDEYYSDEIAPHPSEPDDEIEHSFFEFEEAESNQPPEDPSSLAEIEVLPMIRKAVEKHLREWEELMKRYPYQWAAYRGDERLEIGKTKHGLYRKYLDRGLSLDELVVLGIGPPIEDEIDDEELYDF